MTLLVGRTSSVRHSFEQHNDFLAFKVSYLIVWTLHLDVYVYNDSVYHDGGHVLLNLQYRSEALCDLLMTTVSQDSKKI